MADLNIPEYRVTIDQLKVGVFIRLENVSWFSHPFLQNNFKIKDESQLRILRELGISDVICIPAKSDVLPAKPQAGATPPPPAAGDTRLLDAMWQVKRERAERLRKKKERISLCEEHYATSILDITAMMQEIAAGRTGIVDQATRFVDGIALHFLSDVETTLHLMNIMGQVERIYYHSLNVAILSMMLAKAAGVTPREMQALGMGALFHDIGKTRIEKKILRKRSPLSRAEQAVLERHSQDGERIMSAVPRFPTDGLAVIRQHHERLDGSGYPDRRKGPGIDRLARMAAIADVYDNLCNHPDPLESYTPYQALSCMFAQQKHLFDREYLALFIRSLGVYPPGTVVQLTNGSLGLVISVNPENQLSPSLIIYDPSIPKKEALVLDLSEETDVKVEKSVRLNMLPPEILDYLSLRTRITYYVDQDEAAQ